MKNKILVIGSTGNVGSEVTKHLWDMGAVIKAAVSNDKSTTKVQNGVETVVFNFEKPETYDVALKDVDKVFLMRPPQMGDPKQLYPFIDSCKSAGVNQIVFLSLLGIQYNPFAPHGYIEKYIKKSGIPYTLLRPSFFMQNLSTTHCRDIKESNEIVVPAGRGKTSFIDVRDIAAVAAKVLTSPGHDKKAYDLTGSSALSYFDVSAILSNVTGRQISYNNPSAKVFEKRMLSEGYESDFVSVMKNIYFVNKIGLAGSVTDVVKDLLGREPITFKEFAADNKNLFV